MGQELHVLKCFSCETFQSHIVKKTNKWECKMCGVKQSLKKVYGRGSGKECRLHTQKLNSLKGEISLLEETSQQFVQSQGEVLQTLDSQFNIAALKDNSHHLKKTKWDEFFEVEPPKGEKHSASTNCNIDLSTFQKVSTDNINNASDSIVYLDDNLSVTYSISYGKHTNRNKKDLDNTNPDVLKLRNERNFHSKSAVFKHVSKNQNVPPASLKWSKYLDQDEQFYHEPHSPEHHNSSKSELDENIGPEFSKNNANLITAGVKSKYDGEQSPSAIHSKSSNLKQHVPKNQNVPPVSLKWSKYLDQDEQLFHQPLSPEHHNSSKSELDGNNGVLFSKNNENLITSSVKRKCDGEESPSAIHSKSSILKQHVPKNQSVLPTSLKWSKYMDQDEQFFHQPLSPEHHNTNKSELVENIGPLFSKNNANLITAGVKRKCDREQSLSASNKRVVKTFQVDEPKCGVEKGHHIEKSQPLFEQSEHLTDSDFELDF